MSVIQHSSQRIAVLIDTQNLYHSARHLYNSRVNFGAVLEAAVADRQLVRAIAYLITTEAQDEAQFFEALLKMGIETKSKELQIFYGGNKKADWDVGIAIDAISLSEKVDAIVLVTGDGDFVPLVEFLKYRGVQVEVASFGRSSSSKLREASDAFLDLEEDYKKFILINKKNSTIKTKTVNKRSYKKQNNVVELNNGQQQSNTGEGTELGGETSGFEGESQTTRGNY